MVSIHDFLFLVMNLFDIPCLIHQDHECCVLESKLRDAQRSQETLITEKGKIINELNKQLEEAQLRVRDYTCSVDKEETVRLRIELDQMKADRNALEEKLTDTIVRLCSNIEVNPRGELFSPLMLFLFY